MDLERERAHEVSELCNTFLSCHFPREHFVIEPLAHLCAPVPTGPTEGTPPALVVSILIGGRDGIIPILIWGLKSSEPRTEARALSDARRVLYPPPPTAYCEISKG